MKFLSAVEQAHYHIRTLWIVIFIAFIINIFAIFGWMHSQSTIKVQIPPQIPQSGLTLTQGIVPKTTVYGFAYYIWQSVNHWTNNGLIDYRKQITKFSPYLTPDFKLALVNNYNNLLNQGELQDRIRLMQGLTENDYSPVDVQSIGNNTWLVHLKMHLVEMMSSNAKVVKDVQMIYTLKVIHFNVDAKKNPWGLAVAGFSESPSRIKTKI